MRSVRCMHCNIRNSVYVSVVDGVSTLSLRRVKSLSQSGDVAQPERDEGMLGSKGVASSGNLVKHV
jgi:hypothetical protein